MGGREDGRGAARRKRRVRTRKGEGAGGGVDRCDNLDNSANALEGLPSYIYYDRLSLIRVKGVQHAFKKDEGI